MVPSVKRFAFLFLVGMWASPLLAASSGEAVYQKRCAVCHDQNNDRIPPREALQKLPSARILRALDAGPLASARALEGMTAVIVSLNKRYKGHAGLRVTGLP